ncbi:MAG: siderophore-interacting protein [Sphingobacteriales bacterium]|nr:MAG: siderophore-interacting protein [Sphingobacteriales bacterium]
MPSAPKWLFDSVEFLLPKLPLSEVTEALYLSPSVKKIRCSVNFKKMDFTAGTYIDFRVSDTEARRYTVAFADAENGIIEFIVHVHGNGNGSRFMNSLKAGDKIKFNTPRAYNYYNNSAGSFVVFGDETSLGLACSLLPVLKKNKHPFQFYFELADENRNVPGLLGLENYIVFPKNGSFRSEEWISHLPVIQTREWQEANFVLTGNAKSAQTFRKVIKNKTNGKVNLHGYWLEGKKGL